MNISYTKAGDYYIPDIVLSDTTKYHIGKYGRMHQEYLKENRPILYDDLILTEKLLPYLAEIDETCRRRLDIIIPEMARREGVDAELKRRSSLEWAARMNSIKSRAEETVLQELVYS